MGSAVVFEQSQPLLSTSCSLAAVHTVWAAATVAARLSPGETRRCCRIVYLGIRVGTRLTSVQCDVDAAVD